MLLAVVVVVGVLPPGALCSALCPPCRSRCRWRTSAALCLPSRASATRRLSAACSASFDLYSASASLPAALAAAAAALGEG